MTAYVIIGALFLPLIGGLLTYVFKNVRISIGGMAIGFVLSVLLVLNKEDTFRWSYEWLSNVSLSIQLDAISSLLIALVLFVSLLVHIFSLSYMHEEEGKHRYFAKLGFFTFSMIGLLLADHLLLLFVFWELVGLASYLLIGFWYRKEDIPASARSAFMVNRVADVALLAGILLVSQNGSLEISLVQSEWLFLPSILIAFGAFGKSAQIPFSGWLTQAMVGPTPVSALIHAATMVAAGVYLLIRVAPFLHPEAMTVVALMGISTALYAGLSALFQHDIKKVLAYSTISQLGYMVFGIGIGGAEASLFHLITHAFFKAGLFLGAGSIIHFLHHSSKADPQDMRNMGGLRGHLPWTFITFSICVLALAGLPFFSGFMSKEGIILAAWDWANQQGTWGYLIPDIALITAFITALYVGRMVLLVFFGTTRSEITKPVAESPFMKWPLALLSAGSLWIFFNGNPFAHNTWLFTGDNHPEGSLLITALSVLLVVAGLFMAIGVFKPGTSYSTNYQQQSERVPLLFNGLYLVKGYSLIGTMTAVFSQLLSWVDHKIIDGFIDLLGIGTVVFSKAIALVDRFFIDGPVNGVASLSGFIGRRFAALSSRNVQSQLIWLLIGILLILSWILFF